MGARTKSPCGTGPLTGGSLSRKAGYQKHQISGALLGRRHTYPRTREGDKLRASDNKRSLGQKFDTFMFGPILLL